MTSTITTEQEQAIATFLEGKHIPRGLGSEHEACSIAAINLALAGILTDEIPNCMSPVVGRWIIRIQDVMPDEMRNSHEWRSLLPLAAGSGRNHEAEAVRLSLIMEWMWSTVLSSVQPSADKHGYGAQWQTMCVKRTADAADAAARAVAAAVAARAAAYAAAARAAAYAAAAAAARAARAAAYAAAAAAAAAAADAAVYAAADATVWSLFDPCGLLRRLVEVS